MIVNLHFIFPTLNIFENRVSLDQIESDPYILYTTNLIIHLMGGGEIMEVICFLQLHK